MIIGASRITTSSGAGGVGAHVFEGAKNESIELVRGARADLDDMIRDAQDHGAKYAIRHLKISPEQATSREEALDVVAALGREFGFDPERAVVVEHEKPRQGGKGFDRHWHAMVPEVDPAKGRVLDAHWMRARHEKISRVAELELGHHQVTGKWNVAVERALRAEGRGDLADRVASLAQADRPREAYTAARHQIADRRGMSMPEAKAAVAEAWAQADGGRAFAAALKEKGLTVRQGDRNGAWIVEAAQADGDPVLIGAVHRLTGTKKAEAGAKLADLVDAPAAPDVVPVPQQTPAPAADVAPPAGVSEATPAPGIPVGAPAADAPRQESEGRKEKPERPAPAAPRAPSSEADFVRPLDPSKPDDVARFLREWVAAWEKRQAKTAAFLAALQRHEQQHGGRKRDDHNPGEAFLKWLREAHRPETETPDLERRPRVRTPGRDDGGRPDPRDPRHAGLSGDAPRDLRGPARGEDDAGPDGAAGAARAARGEGTDAAREGALAPRGDGRGHREDRAAAGRARIQARRQSLGFAAAVKARGDRLAELTEQLRHPPTAADMAATALDASDRRTHAVLDAEPWRDPASRDVGRLAGAARGRVYDDASARDAAAVAAADRLRKAQGRIGFLDRVAGAIGVRTVAVRDRDEAAAAADRAEASRPDRRDVDGGLQAAEAGAWATAAERQRQRDTWERRPDVVDARRETHGNRLVREAIAGGDRRIAAVAAHDLGAARDEVLRREAEERLRLEVEARERMRQHQVRERRSGPQPSAPAPGPRRR